MKKEKMKRNEIKEWNGCSLNETFSFYWLSFSLPIALALTHSLVIPSPSVCRIYTFTLARSFNKHLGNYTHLPSKCEQGEQKRIKKEEIVAGRGGGGGGESGRFSSESIVSVFSKRVLYGRKWDFMLCKVHTHK